MRLTNREIENLLRLVDLTREDEFDCEQCLARVAEFAERALAGASVPEGLRTLEHHLAICQECGEEYEILARALRTLDG